MANVAIPDLPAATSLSGPEQMEAVQNGVSVRVTIAQIVTTGNGFSFSAGTTGLTPSSASIGAVVLGGTLGPANGGSGVANNAANTLTFSGNYGLTLTLTAPTILTLPTSGTVTALGNTTTGTGSIVLATSPTLVTPTLGVAAATSLNKVAITAPATGATLTIANGKTLTASNSITLGGTDGKTLTVSNSVALAGTDSTTMTFPSSSATIAGLGIAQTWTAAQTFTNSDLILLGSSTGATTFTSANAGASNFTLTIPAISGTLSMTSGSNLNITDVYRCTTAQTANANTTPANITGLSGDVAVGTYEFEASLYCTIASGTAGVAVNQVLTTAVLGVCNFEAVGFLAAGVATQATTTATSGTVLFAAADQPILVLIKGSFTVTTAGTFALQMCQNTSNASNSVVNIGSTMRLCRIA